MFKLVLEKAEEPEIKLPTSIGSLKKQESSRKTSTSALLTMPKPLTVWITIHCGKFFKRWDYQTIWLVSWIICMQVKKQQLEPDMEQRTGSKSGKEHINAIYCHPAYLTYMQIMLNARLNEAQTGIKTARRNINILRYTDDTALMAESKEELKSLLMKVKEESERVGLKLSSWHLVPSLHGKWMEKQWKQRETLFFRGGGWGLQNHCRWWLQPWN